MCGIIGYIGEREANEILIKGLERLEYRGYDSAGVCISFNNQLQLNKVLGRVNNLKSSYLKGTKGIAHTRWATHGRPSDLNAHPFIDEKLEFSVVHNGIIENYLELKEGLQVGGVKFSSETDSEVIVHLISQAYSGNLREAVLKVVPKLQGAYALCVIKNDSKEIIGARNGSPLVAGGGNQENFFASDVSAIIEHTKKVVYLNDFEVVEIKKDEVRVFNFNNKLKELKINEIYWDIEQSQKQGYKHFMLKEIYEQPKVIAVSLKVNVDNILDNIPGNNPDIIPIRMPGKAEIAVVVNATFRLSCAPTRTRLNISRPYKSVPIGCVHDGSAKRSLIDILAMSYGTI